jgi:hypothetical protein
MLLMVSGALVTGGVVLAVLDQTQDDDGYLMTDRTDLRAEGHAVITDAIELHDPTWLPLPSSFLGDVRVDAESGAGEVFIGIADTDDVDRYLDGVGHSTVVDLDDDGLSPDPRYRVSDGGPPRTEPGDSDIWEVSVSGAGEQSLTWDVESGDWTVVVMNVDGSAPVEVEAAAGATLPGLGWVVGGLLLAGGLGLLIGLGLVVGALLAGRGRSNGVRGQ